MINCDEIFDKIIIDGKSLTLPERKQICDDVITLSRWVNDFPHINKWQTKSLSHEQLFHAVNDRDLVWVLKQGHIAYAVHFFYNCSK